MQSFDVPAFHTSSIEKFNQIRIKLSQQRNLIGWARLVVILAGAGLLYTYWPMNGGSATLIVLFTIAIFLLLLARSVNISRQLELVEEQYRIHQEELAIAQHRFQGRFDGGGLAQKDHAYAQDLDLFGPASLFQWLHRSTSEQGHETLAQWLLQPAPNSILRERQEACADLARQCEWGIRFQAVGQLQRIDRATENRLLDWLKTPLQFQSSAWRLTAIIVPAIALSTLLAHILGYLSAPGFYALLPLFLIIAFAITRRVKNRYETLDKIVPKLITLNRALQEIETGKFEAPLLLQLQQQLGNGTAASPAIQQLRKILDRFDYRLNPLVFLPLNTFLLWDLQQILALERWQQQQQDQLGKWFRVLGTFEALNSLSRLCFNHPEWALPELSDSPAIFQAVQLAHPLIPASKAIANDFSTNGQPAIALITGSNMAGKSTFLRSVGVNQVLAMAGAVACAKKLTVSNLRVMSSMRIADNLEENTSTFYAELRKLKGIIEAVNRHEPLLLLLDEILRGTNSQDRQTGSRALIRQLAQQGAVALLATHDLALTAEPGPISNYHFDVAVNGEELYFDYTLKPGICTSMNASILMKKIGIEL